MDNSLRQIYPIVESDFCRVNEEGQLTGFIGKVNMESNKFFAQKFNGTYLSPKNETLENM